MRPILAALFIAIGSGYAQVGASHASSDVKSIDSIVAALYETISGPAGAERNWDRFRALMAPDAQMSAVVANPDGAARRHPIKIEDYIRLSGPVMKERGFFEKESSRKLERYGNIAHVFSSYESRLTPGDAKPFETGVNSIQLWNDGKRWWIQSILWQGERPHATSPR